MIYTKRVSAGAFLKKGVDFKDGDLLEIANEGKEVQGEFGTQNLFLLKANGKEGNVGFNQTSLNGIIDCWGADSLKWIGKQVKATKIKQNVSGKFLDVWYFAHPDAELTEQGFVLPGVQGKSKDDIPVINDSDEVRVEDVPF